MLSTVFGKQEFNVELPQTVFQELVFFRIIRFVVCLYHSTD